jgi:hypothetical protein
MRFAVLARTIRANSGKNLKGRLKAKLNLVVNGRFHLVLALLQPLQNDDAPAATKHQRPARFAPPMEVLYPYNLG